MIKLTRPCFAFTSIILAGCSHLAMDNDVKSITSLWFLELCTRGKNRLGYAVLFPLCFYGWCGPVVIGFDY